MENINEIVGKNICKLRKQRKMTQMEFAEKLNYSDKAISKWEKGESLPGIEVLKNIAVFFCVTLDELTSEDEIDIKSRQNNDKSVLRKKFVITLLAISLVWTLATITFVCVQMVYNYALWIVFMWSIPISCIIGLIFNSIWGNPKFNYAILTVFNWTIIVSFYLQFLKFDLDLYPLYFLGIPGQIAIILWANLNPKENKKLKEKINKRKNKKIEKKSIKTTPDEKLADKTTKKEEK